MEVKLDKRYPVQASVDQAWAVLADVPLAGELLTEFAA